LIKNNILDFLRKIINIIATRCHILKLNAPNSILDGATSQTPLRELTALPQTPYLNLSKPTSKGRKGRKDGRDGQGRGLTSKGRGREERKRVSPQA